MISFKRVKKPMSSSLIKIIVKKNKEIKSLKRWTSDPTDEEACYFIGFLASLVLVGILLGWLSVYIANLI